jgi:hypothetical protein
VCENILTLQPQKRYPLLRDWDPYKILKVVLYFLRIVFKFSMHVKSSPAIKYPFQHHSLVLCLNISKTSKHYTSHHITHHTAPHSLISLTKVRGDGHYTVSLGFISKVWFGSGPCACFWIFYQQIVRGYNQISTL